MAFGTWMASNEAKPLSASIYIIARSNARNGLVIFDNGYIFREMQ